MVKTTIALIYFLISIMVYADTPAIAAKPEALKNSSNDYVTVKLQGQLGNQLFQIATAYAYSLDHNFTLIIPDLVRENRWNVKFNAARLFIDKIAYQDLPQSPTPYLDPQFYYVPIPIKKNLELFGYFKTEKYFKHRQKEILALFGPTSELKQKLLSKYRFLSSDKMTVGIQIRDYRSEFPLGDHHPTHDRKYYQKAMSFFPDCIFVVSSNNLEFAKQCTTGVSDNIFYLANSDYIEDFYTLCLCKSFIISNSSFGWWAAWLSTSLNKKVVAPDPWFALPYNNAVMTKDILPLDYIILTKEKDDYFLLQKK